MGRSIAQLKHEIGIEDVLIEVGGDIIGSTSWGEWHRLRCPFHGPDRKPSAGYSPERQAWNCMACGEGGDVIDLAKRYLQTNSTREAMSWLETTFLQDRKAEETT